MTDMELIQSVLTFSHESYCIRYKQWQQHHAELQGGLMKARSFTLKPTLTVYADPLLEHVIVFIGGSYFDMSCLGSPKRQALFERFKKGEMITVDTTCGFIVCETAK